MSAAIVRATYQSALLSAASNIISQLVTVYQNNKPLSFDVVQILQFVTYTILNTPLNCIWQDWLEAAYPGSKPVEPKDGADKEKPGQKKVEVKQTLDIKNTIIKFGLDQTVGACFNTVLFIAGIGMLKGQATDEIYASIINDSMPIYYAGVKLWPAVSLLSFTVIPVERRVVFGSIVGVAWGVYLSLQAAK